MHNISNKMNNNKVKEGILFLLLRGLHYDDAVPKKKEEDIYSSYNK